MNANTPLRVVGAEDENARQERPAGPITQEEAYGAVLKGDIAIRNFLEPLREHLDKSGATELFINRPGELLLQVGPRTVKVWEPALTYAALDGLATAVAVYTKQSGFGTKNPILSATLPDGERIQIVIPPAVEEGIISVTIRIPGSSVLDLDQYAAKGAFDNFLWPHPADVGSRLAELLPDDRMLVQALMDRDLRSFIKGSVLKKKNSAVVGDTGSGKTTLMKSMCQLIPEHERLLTSEDVRELTLARHDNRVHLLYSKGGHSVANVTPGVLVASTMRMTPSRVLPAELRGSEAWDFLKLLTSGHSGSITSFHAESCALAFERFMFMAKENTEAASLSRDELKHLVRLTLDVVVHIKAETVFDDNGDATSVVRYVDEVYFDPWGKNTARFGEKRIDKGPRPYRMTKRRPR